jgi:hypothetical protein
LYVNGTRIYSLDLGTGRWFDNSGTDTRTMVISSATLRANGYWTGYSAPPPPSTIPSWELTSLMQAAHGNTMKGQGFFWGGNGAASASASATMQTLRFEWTYRQDVKYGFDTDYSQLWLGKVDCQSGKSVLITAYSSALTDSLASSISGGAVNVDFEKLAESRILQALRARLDGVILGMNLGGGCPAITLGSLGGISISRP